jgi:hypothetical protein
MMKGVAGAINAHAHATTKIKATTTGDFNGPSRLA